MFFMCAYANFPPDIEIANKYYFLRTTTVIIKRNFRFAA